MSWVSSTSLTSHIYNAFSLDIYTIPFLHKAFVGLVVLSNRTTNIWFSMELSNLGHEIDVTPRTSTRNQSLIPSWADNDSGIMTPYTLSDGR